MGPARTWVVAGLIVAACHRGSPPRAILCCAKASPLQIVDAGSAGAAVLDAGVAVEPVAGPRFRREDGCARDFKASGSVGRDMTELQRLCAQGMAPVADAVAVTPGQGGVAEATFRITSLGACLRAGAVAPSGTVALSLLGPGGEVLASASSNEPLSVAPADGTVCVREPGAYRASIRVSPEVTSASVQLWQARRRPSEAPDGGT